MIKIIGIINNFNYHINKSNSSSPKNSLKKHRFLSILESADGANSRAMRIRNIVFKRP